MPEYRWNQTELARGYDEAAEHIHPYYKELQRQILQALEGVVGELRLIVDAGGGSGRLADLILQRFPDSRAVVVDQSAAFLDLARERLESRGDRARCHLARLQDDWFAAVDQPSTIVSMSAIHHLDADEKRRFYQRCFDALAPGGILLNGDEVRPPDDDDYLRQCQTWAGRMHKVIHDGLVSDGMSAALLRWEERNVGQFGEPRSSGDDCHETIDIQCEYLRDAGFDPVDVPWTKDMWALLRGVKPSPG